MKKQIKYFKGDAVNILRKEITKEQIKKEDVYQKYIFNGNGDIIEVSFYNKRVGKYLTGVFKYKNGLICSNQLIFGENKFKGQMFEGITRRMSVIRFRELVNRFCGDFFIVGSASKRAFNDTVIYLFVNSCCLDLR